MNQGTAMQVTNAGVPMPGLLYGTAWKKEQTADCVSLAIEQGFRGIDTACQPKHYNEPGVGQGVIRCLQNAALRLSREQLYLQTKFTPVSGQDPARVPYDPSAPLTDQLAQSFKASLHNLQTSYLDCLVLHSPLQTRSQTMEVWRAMEALVDSGGVRQLGISNCYDPGELERLHAGARIKPAILQNRFYADTGYDREIRAYCRQQGIIYQSFWTLTANPRLLESVAVRRLAGLHSRTPAQVLFRYLTQQGAAPLTGTRSEAHMREDLAIFDFELSTDECAAVTALL
jgi:diketogulonate reductase-like aldo/keto reductase